VSPIDLITTAVIPSRPGTITAEGWCDGLSLIGDRMCWILPFRAAVFYSET
jgi:hypothetical protein